MHAVVDSTATRVLILEINSHFSPVVDLSDLYRQTYTSGEKEPFISSNLIHTDTWTVGGKLH